MNSLLKLSALALVILGASGVGYSEVKRQRNRRESLARLVTLLHTIAYEVHYEKNTLGEILHILSRQGTEMVKKICDDLQNEMKENRQQPLPRLWRQVLEKCPLKTWLGKEEMAHLYGLSDCFTTTDTKQVKAKLERECTFFEGRLTEAQKGEKDREKTIMSLSVMGGLFVCIVLW